MSDIDGVTWSHKQGELNRADRAPFDVSVKEKRMATPHPPFKRER